GGRRRGAEAPANPAPDGRFPADSSISCERSRMSSSVWGGAARRKAPVRKLPTPSRPTPRPPPSVNREHHRWHSPSLGREMDLLVLGHAGARVLVFPTSLGSAFEWEDRGMHHALGEHLERGWLQLYCVDSYNAESWYAKWMHPADRSRRQDAYEQYLLDEVLPLSRQRNPNPFLITTGASFGAFHAVDFAFRHPHLVGRVIGMSGLYDITEQTDGYYD